MRSLRKSLVIAIVAAVASLSAACGGAGDDTVYIGVSGPVTGPNAEYGRLWKQGFDLALDRINAEGGIDGKKVALKWEDSQSDPKQAVPIAQKFVNDTSVIAELGDFSSPASMAASQIYQRRGLVQYGFTNSHPDFTKAGDKIWSPSLTQAFYQRANAANVTRHAKKVAVVFQQTDWGRTSFDLFSAAAKQSGVDVVYSSPFLADSTDFRPVLIKARDAAPDAIVHLGYGPDGALIVKQARDVGFQGQLFAGQNTPEFLRLAGPAAEGDIITASFVNSDPRPEVQAFVAEFRARYQEDPGEFNVYAYDALTTVVNAARHGGATREGVQKGLLEVKNFPSVQFGPFSFNGERRPNDVTPKELVVRDGVFRLNQP